MAFERLIGHQDAVMLLRRALAADRLAHAYLITGPRGVGRRTLALLLAGALNCLCPEVADRPCGHCRQCRLIDRGVHPDVRVVKRAPERRAILLRPPSATGAAREYADNVAFIQSDAHLRPADGRRKVYLILNAEELAPEAANRLLKSIEEPTPFVHFLLTAGDRGAVLPTIVSRCQELRLRPVPRPVLAGALLAAGVERPEQVAALAGGRPGWALAAARDPSLLERHRADLLELREALAATRLRRLALARALAERWASQPERLRATLRAWMEWWREVLLAQLGQERHLAHIDPAEGAALRALAARISPAEARAARAQAQRAFADLEANVNARLALDLLLLRLPAARG